MLTDTEFWLVVNVVLLDAVVILMIIENLNSKK